MRIAHIALGLATVALGVFAIVSARSLALFGDHHVSGPAFFPDLISVVLIVLGLLLTVKTLLGGRVAGAAPGPATPVTAPTEAAAVTTGPNGPMTGEPAGVPSGLGRIPRAASVWIGFVVAIVLLGYLGFIPTMVVFAAYLIFAVERIRRPWAIAAVFLIPLIAYAVFSYLLGVNLPEIPFLDYS
jgi:hypothetical protein